MDRIPLVNLLPTLVALLLLQGVVSAQSRSVVSSGNQLLQSKDDSNIQNRILAFLLHKNRVPVQDDVIEIEMASRITELQELDAIREALNLERQLSSRAMDRASSQPAKRSDACFWKYCV
ncbi:urotensin 2 domain containing [Astyanax mexicanus]|uniref:urotensin 2 domain containing n=1 Tax=Astyanax mexicanus TaxID=7994 RepID=UPI0020CAABB4|nr:urotensin 2 domain containing [Astyanax mexicanus]